MQRLIPSGAAVVKLQLSTGIALSVTTMEGYVTGGAANAIFLQYHNTAAEPANGVVPLYSYMLVPDDGFRWKNEKQLQNLPSGGIWLMLSTTEATLTKVASDGSTGKADFFVLVEEYEQQTYTPTTIVGDLTTNVDVLRVWDSSPPSVSHVLNKLEIVASGVGSTFYAFVFAKNGGTAGSNLPQCPPILCQDSATTVINFGNNAGQSMCESISGVNWTDCYIELSTTNIAPFVRPGGTTSIRATYTA